MSNLAATIVTDGNSSSTELDLLPQLMQRELPGGLRWSRCDQWLENLAADCDELRWIFVDLRKQSCSDGLAALIALRDRIKRRGPHLIGVVDRGYTLDQARHARDLLDAALCVPFGADDLRELLAKLPPAGSRAANHGADQRTLETSKFRFVTRSQNVFPLCDQITLAAQHDFTILLVGETGTGKTSLSGVIHELSSRRNEPFVHVACGSLPNELIDSELFGHVKGSFTGALANKEGKFTAARGGTLLLDEIDVLALPQQAKLLRVLESREFEPIGSNTTQRVKARIIVATNRDLDEQIAKQEFRPDLYFRLNQVKFEIPPLRMRTADIVPLALQFIDEACCHGEFRVERIHPDFLHALESYDWPGNIRELKNEIGRSIVFAQNGVLDPLALSPGLQQAVQKEERATPAPGLAGDVAHTEQESIERMLRAHDFNRAATARALGISRVTLYNKIRKYRIRVENPGRDHSG